MDGPSLLKALMASARDNPNSLASKLKNKPRQSSIHRFAEGESHEPKRSTLEPIALHYGVPVEAFWTPRLAKDIAAQRHLVNLTAESAATSTDGGKSEVDPPSLIPISMPFSKVNLSHAIKLLGSILESVDGKSRKYISPILADLALAPEDADDLAERAVSQAKAKPQRVARDAKLNDKLTHVGEFADTGRSPLGH